MVNGTMIRGLLVLAAVAAFAGTASAFSVTEIEPNNSISSPQHISLIGGTITILGALSDTPDYYSFEAAYDSYVSITVTRPSEFTDSYWVNVFDPTGDVAGRAKSRSSVKLSNMNTAYTGRYTAVVSGDSSGATGVTYPFTYNLSIVVSDQPIGSSSVPGSPVPEPGSIAAVGAGLSCSILLAFRRRLV